MRVLLFNPFLDQLIAGIDRRFNQETIQLIESMGRLLQFDIPLNELKMIAQKLRVKNISMLQADVTQLINDPLIPKGSSTSVLKEWLDWFKHYNRDTAFSEFYAIIQNFSVLPVSSASNERSFSTLGRIKSKLRTTQKQDRVESLTLLAIGKELAKTITPSEIIDEFKNIVDYKRRMMCL